MTKKLFFLCLTLLPLLAFGQSYSMSHTLDDETIFYAQTKQVNQFLRRFNSEEDQYGERLYPSDKFYHDNSFRRQYLNILFDKQSTRISTRRKQAFIHDVTDSTPSFLQFTGGRWYAEVAANFNYEDKAVNLVLFLKLEQENLGHKWVLTNVYFDRFSYLLDNQADTLRKKNFLHPMSHELDFMNLRKVLRNSQHIQDYGPAGHQADYLSLFYYEIKTGKLKFESVDQVKFHFFQINNWYFELAYFNRHDKNSGWLISNLLEVQESDKNALIRNFENEN